MTPTQGAGSNVCACLLCQRFSKIYSLFGSCQLFRKVVSFVRSRVFRTITIDKRFHRVML